MTAGEQTIAPVTKLRVATLAGAAVGIYLGWLAIGWALTRLDTFRDERRDDLSLVRWLAGHRTPGWDTATGIMSLLGGTEAVVAGTVIVVVTLRVWLGRWRESIVVVVAVAGEVILFLALTASVERLRPPVPHLDPAPPTSSYPSGHTAAAVALYGTLGVVLLLRMVQRRLGLVLALLCFAVPLLVAGARLYRGMHYPSDVLFGLLASGCWVTVVLVCLLKPPGRPARSASGAAGG